MGKITLLPYEFGIRRKNARNSLPLNNLFGQGITMHYCILEILKKYNLESKKIYKDQEGKHALIFGDILKKRKDDLQFIQTTIYYGEYGVLLDALDMNTGQIHEGVVSKNTSLVHKLTFTYVETPKCENLAFIILSKFSIHSCKTLLTKLFYEFFKTNFSVEFSIDFEPRIEREIISYLEKNKRINRVTLVSRGFSKRAPKRLIKNPSAKGVIIENIREIKVSLKAHRKGNLVSLKRIKEFVDAITKIFEDPQQEPFYKLLDSTNNKVQIEVASKNETKVIDFFESGVEMKQGKILPDEAVISNKGKIEIDYILNNALKYGKELISKMKLPEG